MSCDEISFEYLEYSSSACFPVFSKNIKVFWENFSVLTEGSNDDSVALGGVCVWLL